MTNHFLKNNHYRTRNGSLVECIIVSDYSITFKVLEGGESLGGFPENHSWAGRCPGGTYVTHPNGIYKGEIEAMDVMTLEERFSLNKQYLTNNDSLVEYMGDLKFKLIKVEKTSKKAPWNTLPEGAIYLANTDGSYLGSLRGLDIRNKIEKPENDTQI